MNKKILIIIIIAFLALLIIGIYYWMKTKKEKQAPVIEGRISEITMEGPSISDDLEWIYYYSNYKKPGFYRLNLKNRAEELLYENIDDIDNIQFSPNRESVAFRVIYQKDKFEKYGSPFLTPIMEDGAERYWTLNFKEKKLSPLNENIISLVFSTDSKKIIYNFQATSERITINRANVDGGSYEKMADWDKREPTLYSYDENKVFIGYETDEGEVIEKGLFALDIAKKQMNLILVDKASDKLSISPKKDKLLFYEALMSGEKLNSHFWTTNASGLDYQDIIKVDDAEFDYKHIAWRLDESSFFSASKKSLAESYDAVQEINLASKKIKQVFSFSGSAVEVVGLNENDNIIYLLIDAQLYAKKLP